MKMHQKFSGTGVALVTPFDEFGKIDFESLEQLFLHVVKGGVDYVVVMGTTGESPTLAFDEKQAVLSAIVDLNATYQIPIVLGVGGNDTADIIHHLHTYDLHGVSAILSVSPYYNKPTQEGLYAHYKAIADASRLPIILYNVPGRTGSNILPETVCRLARDCRNIIGVKEASGNIVQCMELTRIKPADFLVISGDDNLVLPQMAVGMNGIISVAANAYPKEVSELVNLIYAGKYEKASKVFYKMLPGIDLMFAEGNPSGIKYYLSKLGLCKNAFRLPLVPVGAATAAKIDAFMDDFAK
jgi:4-hydroxy-tetrahydrodipicolinate synthase